MNKNLIPVGVAAVIGAGVGWFIGSVIVEYQRAMKEHLATLDDAEENEPTETSESINERNDSMGKQKKALKPYNQYFTREKASLAELSAKYRVPKVEETKEEVEETFDDFEPEETTRPTQSAEPYIISLMEFRNSDTGFQQRDLSYYEQDDILVDEKNVPIPDPEKIVGNEALVSFGEDEADDDIICVRNVALRGEYRISREHGGFVPAPKAVRRGGIKTRKVVQQDEEEDA